MKRDFTICLLGVLCLFSPGFSNAQNPTHSFIEGYVFNDKNNNGTREKNEEGIKDVLVSDQLEIVATNAEGLYRLEHKSDRDYVFVSQPNGYVVKGSFWKSIGKSPSPSSVDFPLVAAPKSTTFTFIHASDTHLSEQSLPRLQKLKSLVDSLKPAFMLVTGDLIKDALRVSEKEAAGLYELYVREIGKFALPVWNVPGNHEIFGIERHKSLVSESHPLYGKKMYRHYLGPDYYSFSYGGIHFMGLNSVDYHDLWYYGHIDSVQLNWIKRETSFVNKSTPIITFNHIPFFSAGMTMDEYREEEPGSILISINGKKQYRHVVTNAIDVMDILKATNFPVALGGHYHFSQKFTFDSDNQKTEFHQSGAVVGPTSGGGFNMPSGVILYTVVNGKITDRKFIILK